jgi:hypothetical protein
MKTSPDEAVERFQRLSWPTSTVTYQLRFLLDPIQLIPSDKAVLEVDDLPYTFEVGIIFDSHNNE